MNYKTLMVHLELGQSNTGLLRVTADIAELFDATVIGIAASQPMQILYSDTCPMPESVVEQDRQDTEAKIDMAEAEFRRALGTRALDWRSALTLAPLSTYIASEARSADLIIASDAHGASRDGSRHVNKSDLLMQLGRPLLIVPATAERLALDRIVVGWKEACEPRRAVLDALPLLTRAAAVEVVEIADAAEMTAAAARVADVARWLERHGAAAISRALLSNGHDAAALNAFAQERAADVIVAGAYGHSRLREWVLGGVTRDLLSRADRCSLLSR